LDTNDSYCDALVSATPELLREAAAILRKKSDLLVQLAVTREQEPEDSLIEQLLEMRAKREGKR
jgi:chromatin segregation and condensation protein Rec8/ScpA/Scc1 (kleisin family)